MNTGLYCEINLPTGDTVTAGPTQLPNNYTDYQGNYWTNLRDPAVWPDSRLRAIGWYPYVENDAGPPGSYYDRTLSDFAIGAVSVTRDAIYTQWDIDRVRRAKEIEMQSQLTVYSVNDRAINLKIDEYVQNETKWLSEKQVELVTLDDWNAVASFDTTKPAVLVLPNSFVGESYVNQANQMQAENQAATANGLPAPWDSTELSTFVTANQAAAVDASNATTPLEPGYKLRQRVATRAERFARVVIFRTSRDDPNPAWRTTYKMRMFNRQDNRDLYVFSYTNGTYLTWRQFLDLGNGVWGLEATSAEWTHVPADMAFIFSYGTNPAVEADYFTDRVEFPAGVQVKQIIVAWDTQ